MYPYLSSNQSQDSVKSAHTADLHALTHMHATTHFKVTTLHERLIDKIIAKKINWHQCDFGLERQ